MCLTKGIPDSLQNIIKWLLLLLFHVLLPEKTLRFLRGHIGNMGIWVTKGWRTFKITPRQGVQQQLLHDYDQAN